MATKTKVIVAGAGIAGPVLALFLKTKGYEPVIYEKINEVNDVGLSILYVYFLTSERARTDRGHV